MIHFWCCSGCGSGCGCGCGSVCGSGCGCGCGCGCGSGCVEFKPQLSIMFSKNSGENPVKKFLK